jgi:hypothetical protein
VPLYGMQGVGAGKDTAASAWIVAALERPDSRPLWVCIWSGAADLAQALWTIRQTHAESDVSALVAKLRVYSISDQDDAGPWIRRNFPDMFWIASLHAFSQYRLATWPGISGEKFFGFEGPDPTQVSSEWLSSHIRKGPLGELYPLPKYIMEGDTPSFLYLIPNGLGNPAHPEYGSWGGRYGKVTAADGLYTDTSDTVTGVDGRTYSSNQATIWRWRTAYQNDFAGRMQWTLTSSARDAPHNPVLVVNGTPGREAVDMAVTSGDHVELDGSGSRDPDGGELRYLWFPYPEATGGRGTPRLELQRATTVKATFTAPLVAQKVVYHVILEAHADSATAMVSYRRVLVAVSPKADH